MGPEYGKSLPVDSPSRRRDRFSALADFGPIFRAKLFGDDLTDWTAFILASLALLAAPGPTNVLLAASGAAAGLRASLRLVAAGALGYAIAVAVLALALGPAIAGSPVATIALKLACSAWLVWSAVQMWREGSDAIARSAPVDFGRVFITTLLNPKSIVFALVILPFLKNGKAAQAAPYVLTLLALLVAVSLAWIAAGAVVRASEAAGEGVMRKVGAAALALFGVLLSTSVLMPIR